MERVLDILEEICGVDDFREDRDINLFDTGLLDSLGVIELLVALEEELKIKVEPTEVERQEIETPNKIYEYILKRGYNE